MPHSDETFGNVGLSHCSNRVRQKECNCGENQTWDLKTSCFSLRISHCFHDPPLFSLTLVSICIQCLHFPLQRKTTSCWCPSDIEMLSFTHLLSASPLRCQVILHPSLEKALVMLTSQEHYMHSSVLNCAVCKPQTHASWPFQRSSALWLHRSLHQAWDRENSSPLHPDGYTSLLI